MNNWKGMLAVCLIFAGGVITGAVVARKSMAVRPRTTQASFLQPSVLLNRVETVRRATRQLELSPEQTAKIDKIFQAAREQVKARVDYIRPLVREDLAKMRREVESELTPEQRAKFQERFKPKSERSSTNSVTSSNTVSTPSP